MPGDAAVYMKVKTELGVHDIPPVDVRVNDGRAVLEGTVPSPEKASEIEDLCWRVEGVAGVDNRLRAS